MCVVACMLIEDEFIALQAELRYEPMQTLMFSQELLMIARFLEA
jgi:hypothetical protein